MVKPVILRLTLADRLTLEHMTAVELARRPLQAIVHAVIMNLLLNVLLGLTGHLLADGNVIIIISIGSQFALSVILYLTSIIKI